MRNDEPKRSRTHVLLLGASVFLVAAAPALAQQSSPPDGSAVDAYVESVPTASGVTQYVEAVPTGSGAAASAAVETGTNPPIDNGATVAEALETIVDSQRYGGPAPSPPVAVPPSGDDPALTVSVAESVLTALESLGTASDTHLIGLLLVVLLTTAVAVVVSARRGPN